jgi:hypothetical protein
MRVRHKWGLFLIIWAYVVFMGFYQVIIGDIGGYRREFNPSAVFVPKYDFALLRSVMLCP